MRSLIIEDDFASRMILQRLMMLYGETEIAVDGLEGLEKCKKGLEAGTPYDLICLDLMLPRMDGQHVLKQIRALEIKNGITKENRVHIIMTTALQDKENVIEALPLCDAYLVKPINRVEFVSQLKKFGVI